MFPLKQGLAVFMFFQTKEELDQLKEDLHTMINKDDIVLVVPLGNETEQHAGMLSEEKVIDIHTYFAIFYQIRNKK